MLKSHCYSIGISFKSSRVFCLRYTQNVLIHETYVDGKLRIYLFLIKFLFFLIKSTHD